jgi:hypothetical protein
MTEVIPVYIKGKDEVLLLEPAPTNQAIHGDKEATAPPKALPKGDAKASAKTAKVTLVLDPLSITRVNSEGQKQTKLIVTVGTMKFEAMVNSKSFMQSRLEPNRAAKQLNSSKNWQTAPLSKPKITIKPVLKPTEKANGTEKRTNQPLDFIASLL